MRLRRLDLVRFGHFTDAAFELPLGDVDFHVVFGPNEAGKSTALTAIEDLLFGIPTRSPYNFLHDYKDMRIGAVLERNGSMLELRRRKGTKDTLLNTDDLPLPGGEGTLRPFLESADRAFFERMFSLDHARLEQGGREILSASDEVGQMLFSAGAGIGGLRDRLTKLEEEADSLWGPRRAARRLYTQAESRMNDEQRVLRDHTLTAKQWNDLRRALENAEDDCREIEEAIRQKSAEAKRLDRIRRIYRFVRRKSQLEQQIKALGEVVELPEDASHTLETSEREASIAAGSIQTIASQLRRSREELKGLTYDEALVARADDIRALNERRIEIRGERADLPKRKAELEAGEKELVALARELEWRDSTVDELLERIPARSVVKVVSTLLGKRAALVESVASAAGELEEAESEVDRLTQQIRDVGELPDVSGLKAAIKAVREMGDVGERVLTAEQKARDAAKRVERIRASLNPNVESASTVAAIKVPSTDDIQQLRDAIKECEQRQRQASGQHEASEEELNIARTEFQQTIRDEHAITRDELEESRNERNALWELVKRKHIEGAAVGEAERAQFAAALRNLPEAFEAKMRVADQTADVRFANAEASGRLAEMTRSIELKEERIGRLRAKATDLDGERETLNTQWISMWADAPFEPLSPGSMLEWNKTRGELLEVIEAEQNALSALEQSSSQEEEAKESLLREMIGLDVDREHFDEARLRVVLERASALQEHHASEESKLEKLKEDLAATQVETERRERKAQRANDAWAEWQAEWGSALENLGLATSSDPAAVEAQVDVIDRMREKESDIRKLRNERIAKIERDIEGFTDEAEALVQAVAPDLSELPADDAALKLVERLDEAERVQNLGQSKQSDIEEREEQISELETTRDNARLSVQHLHDTAATDSVDALKQAISSSDQLRAFRSELKSTVETLEKEGDGLTTVDLEQECAAINVDEITAVQGTNAAELEELEQRRNVATEVRSKARVAFEAVGGDDVAARAEALRQEALADMGEAAARYSRVRASATLLKWAIDRFRREKQAPMLKRAGELFAKLTGGSFSELRIDYDENDTAQLIGRRPSGENVQVSGMSSGTADQLYLALRVASVADYLDRAGGLPFVADDLFINFDNRRAASGFRVLEQLARKTQVLFFTHHQHLVDLAHGALGESVNVVSLE